MLTENINAILLNFIIFTKSGILSEFVTIIGEIKFPKTIPMGLAIPVIVVANTLWLVGNQNSATFVGANRTNGCAHPAIIWPIIAIMN